MKITTRLFISADECLKDISYLLLVWVISLITFYTFVFTHITSVMKPVQIFMTRRRVSKSLKHVCIPFFSIICMCISYIYIYIYKLFININYIYIYIYIYVYIYLYIHINFTNLSFNLLWKCQPCIKELPLPIGRTLLVWYSSTSFDLLY